MPLDKCSAAMSFQVGFKSVGFFFVFKGNRIFDAPRSEFRCMRHIAFVVFFKAGFQVFGTANVKMCSGCFINENVNVMKGGHNRKSFRITFVVVRCRVARLHLLRRLRRGSLPLRVRSSIRLLRNWLAEAKSKMPFDECSAAMSFQVGFKSVCFFSVFECYCVFDFPRFVFGCVRNITFIVFFKAGFQVFGTADIEMRSG